MTYLSSRALWIIELPNIFPNARSPPTGIRLPQHHMREEPADTAIPVHNNRMNMDDDEMAEHRRLWALADFGTKQKCVTTKTKFGC